MATNIRQTPLFTILPVGQQIIFTIENNNATSQFFNVKYIAELHVSRSPINLSSTSDLIATFKTTPNNAGVGIFDFQNILENYVGPQNRGGESGAGSRYKGVSIYDQPHPIHVIDQYSRNLQGIFYFAIQFKTEGSSTQDGPVSIIPNQAANSDLYLFFNGVLQRENYLTRGEVDASGTLVQGANYGYDLNANLFYLGSETVNSKFLTNAPTTQYANINDYGTFAFFDRLPDMGNRVKQIYFTYYNSAGVQIGNEILFNDRNRGGNSNANTFATTKYLFVGAFPGNLQNTSTTFKTLVAAGTIQGGYYTVQAQQESSLQLQQLYTINLNCPTAKGYESIRLAWLNQWGAWDYYTFTMKSVRSTTTNRTTYTQMGGTWNNSVYEIEGYKGGKKNFRVNSTERIQINSDFLTEADAVWFEGLINSQSVYILNGYQDETPPYFTITNKYVEPVLITTSSYTRKTIANDKLIQYTFDLERNKTQKTQPA